MSLMLKDDRKLLNLRVLVLWGGVVGITKRCLPELCMRVFYWQSRRERKLDIYLQHSHMSQSCKIRLGDSGEVVCIQIPRQRDG